MEIRHMLKELFSSSLIKQHQVQVLVLLYGLLMLATCAVFSKLLPGIHAFWFGFLMLFIPLSLMSVVAFGFFRLFYTQKFSALSRSLVASSEKRNRHLFIPDATPKISAAIEFHFEQLLDENEQLFTEIHEKETIYDSILNTQEELVFIIDNDGYISYRNRSFDEIFGAPSLDFDEESSIFSENLSVLMQQISPLIFDKSPGQKQNHLLSRIGVKGETRYISWAINRVSNLESLKTLFVGRDETEDLEIRRKNEQLQKIATVGRAASTIFHEINQPLSIMHLSTFMIKTALESEHGHLSLAAKNELLQNATIIESQVNRANQIVNNLRLFHSGGKKKLVFEPINLNDLINDALSAIDADLQDKNIELVVDLLHSGDEVISGNKTLFVQVLVNILKNSIQALNLLQTASDKRIRVSSKICNETVFIAIEDSGPGIPQGELSKATEPFYTTKEEGSGLGLALCVDILNSYQGQLELLNIEPHGLRAIIRLPFKAAS
jgi:two-component system sporulation sensor kinase C